MWTGCCVNVVWAVAFVHVETVITIVNSSVFEDYCHVWCATTRLVEICRCVWGKSVNFHEATPLSRVTRLDTVYSLPSLQQMPFICIFLQRILLKLSVSVICFGSALFYIYKLVLNCILFCIINIIACYIVFMLIYSVYTPLWVVCCPIGLVVQIGVTLYHSASFITYLFLWFVAFVPQTPAVFNLFCSLYACLEFMYCTTAATVQINVSFKSYFCVFISTSALVLWQIPFTLYSVLLKYLLVIKVAL